MRERERESQKEEEKDCGDSTRVCVCVGGEGRKQTDDRRCHCGPSLNDINDVLV